jgi:Tfp pilus assembly protein PilF
MRALISALLLLATTTVHAASTPQWTEVRSPHFVILTDSNEKQGRKLAGQFERMRSLFQTVLPYAAGDAGLPITVLALKDRKGFQALVPASYLGKGQIQLDGFFLRTSDRNYILLRLDAENDHPFSVVYHEYTHFILRKAEWIPLWLNEGLAEFYQNTDILEKGVHLGQPNSDDILYLRQQRLLPLATLFAVDHNSPYYHDEQKGSVFYAESWALTHYLKITDFQSKKDRIGDYARFLVKGEDSVTAARHAFGDLGLLQKALDSYVSHADYQMFGMTLTFTADEASFTARPVSLSDVNSVRADVLANNNRQPEAKALLEEVLRDDPKNALAHETMGSLAFRDHDLAGAKKWYGEAVQLNSQSYLANYNYAVFSMMDNDTGKDDSIESSLRQAIKLEPRFAPPYDALANFYTMHHKNLDEAHMLSVQAVQLDPTEVRYRLNAAHVAMEQQNPDSALSILHAAKDAAKNPADIAMVDQQIEQIERYKAQVESFHKQEAEASVEAHVVGESPAEPEPAPYPAAPPAGPHHTARGVLRSVHCAYPTLLTLSVDQAGKLLSLYANNYMKIAYSTTNFVPKGDLDPCKAIEGMKARVEYTTVTDNRVAGQIVSIELSK